MSEMIERMREAFLKELHRLSPDGAVPAGILLDEPWRAAIEALPPTKLLIYVNTSKEVGDVDHLKVFANVEAMEKWFAENDPEGVAFEYEVIE